MNLQEIYKYYGLGVKVKLPGDHKFRILKQVDLSTNNYQLTFESFPEHSFKLAEQYILSPFWLMENEEYKFTHCSSCRAEIIFIKLANSGKSHPIEINNFQSIYKMGCSPNQLVINLNLKIEPITKCFYGFPSHFDNCPDASNFRK